MLYQALQTHLIDRTVELGTLEKIFTKIKIAKSLIPVVVLQCLIAEASLMLFCSTTKLSSVSTSYKAT